MAGAPEPQIWLDWGNFKGKELGRWHPGSAGCWRWQRCPLSLPWHGAALNAAGCPAPSLHAGLVASPSPLGAAGTQIPHCPELRDRAEKRNALEFARGEVGQLSGARRRGPEPPPPVLCPPPRHNEAGGWAQRLVWAKEKQL